MKLKNLMGAILAMSLWMLPWSNLSAGDDPQAVSAPAKAASESAETGPRIRFLSETENLGDVTQGESVDRIFVFFNDGDATLQIHEVRPS